MHVWRHIFRMRYLILLFLLEPLLIAMQIISLLLFHWFLEIVVETLVFCSCFLGVYHFRYLRLCWSFWLSWNLEQLQNSIAPPISRCQSLSFRKYLFYGILTVHAIALSYLSKWHISEIWAITFFYFLTNVVNLPRHQTCIFCNNFP